MRRLIIPLVLLLFPSTLAHVPEFGAAGASPETAFVIEDATKSWVFFEEGSADGAYWYTFDLAAGDVLYISTAVPPAERGRPTVWLFGPGLPDPPTDQAPEGTMSMLVTPVDDLGVEPFTPLAMRTVAEFRGTAPETGTYYALVLTPSAMHYSLAIGARESFTPVEWVTTPIGRLDVVSWGGVHWIFALVGEVLGVAGATYLARGFWRSDPRRLVGYLGSGAVAGTAVTVLLLAAIAAWRGGVSGGLAIPVVFAAAAAGIGFGAWRQLERDGPRWSVALLGIGGLVAWAGLIFGPLLLLVWAAWPPARAPTSPSAP